MAMPDPPDDILTKILGIIGSESWWRLGPFLRSGKRAYALMSRILSDCLNAGNVDAIYFESLLLATRHGELAVVVALLETNVPTDDQSTVAYGIFNVCLGEEVKESHAFQQFVHLHDKLESESVEQMCNGLEWQLSWFHPPHMDRYGSTFKYPNDEVIKILDCVNDHDPNFERFYKACNAFWTTRDVCRML
ncbi:hypothetical protein N665_0962s0005 [Sinapis alba]|nr:hypothetical protein N665_0962s0005 [Sinapis alba]